MELTVRTDRLVAGGDAMGRADDGRVVFVTGALPGELVNADIVEAKKDFVRSRVRLVLEPSADRLVPVCAHRRAGCGGCGWMHLEPTAQLTAKVEIVRESLRRIGRLDAAVVDDLVRVGGAVDPFGYRTTIRVVGGPDGTLGYREERTNRVVPITSCPIAESALSRLLSKIQLDEGAEITLRTSVATGQITALWPREHRHGVRGVPTGVHIGERAWLTERIAGVDLRVSAGSFFQSGAQGAELVVGAIGRAAPELATAAHAVDAYGGVGLFAATVMATAGHVTLIESSKSACFDAQHNLTDRSATIVKSEVGRWRADPGRPVDVVVADPARSGLGKPGADVLTAPAAPVFVLVSCDPVSLARDVTLMAQRGYAPESVEVLDLFPNTPHVETVTRFTLTPT
ncbi:MAG: TRAM domain-containing protein [Ilumatobacteraceae bacterium]